MDIKGLGGSALPPKSAVPGAGGILEALQGMQLGEGGSIDPKEFVAKVIGMLPTGTQARVRALEALQERYSELHSKYFKERRELEAKYNALYAPIWSERAGVVSGSKDVDGAAGDGGIEAFWLKAMRHMDLLADLITDKDAEVLAYLTDIACDEHDDDEGSSFTLTFNFKENPFFSNSKLTKTYHFADEESNILNKAEGTTIDWKQGKNVTVKMMKRRPKKGGKASAPQYKEEQVESFFNFFTAPQIPDEGEEIDEDEMDRLQEEMEQDYEIGSIIREKLIPEALRWFTGEAALQEGLLAGGYADEDDDEDDEDDEDDDDRDDDDEDDDDDESPAKPKSAGKPAAGDNQQAPECKQQ